MRAQAVGVPQFTESLDAPGSQLTKPDASKTDFATMLEQATGNAPSTPSVLKESLISDDLRGRPKTSNEAEDTVGDLSLDGKSPSFLKVISKEIASDASAAASHLPQSIRNTVVQTHLKQLTIHIQPDPQHSRASKPDDALSAIPHPAEEQEDVKSSVDTNIATANLGAPPESQALVKLLSRNAQAQKQIPQTTLSSEHSGEIAKSAKSAIGNRKVTAAKSEALSTPTNHDAPSKDIQATSVDANFNATNIVVKASEFPLQTANRSSLVGSTELSATPTAPKTTNKNALFLRSPSEVKQEGIPVTVADASNAEQESIASFSPEKGIPSTPSTILESVAGIASSEHGTFVPVAITLNSSITNGHGDGTKNPSAAVPPMATGAVEGTVLPHTMLSATPNTLEVGVANGTHGWLKIRAELTGTGEVNASLTGSSAIASNRLRNDLPALSSYLQAEKVQVNGLEVHTLPGGVASNLGNSDRSTYDGSDSFPGHSDREAMGGHPQQQDSHETKNLPGRQDSNDGLAIAWDQAPDSTVLGGDVALGGNEILSSVEYRAGSGWLNVRA